VSALKKGSEYEEIKRGKCPTVELGVQDTHLRKKEKKEKRKKNKKKI